jgi:hypothetical protein
MTAIQEVSPQKFHVHFLSIIFDLQAQPIVYKLQNLRFCNTLYSSLKSFSSAPNNFLFPIPEFEPGTVSTDALDGDYMQSVSTWNEQGMIKVKAKVKLFPFLTKHHTVKTCWGVKVRLHPFFNSALDGGEWSASLPGHFTTRERAHDTHWVGAWVGLRTGLDAVEKKNPFTALAGYRTPVVKPIA